LDPLLLLLLLPSTRPLSLRCIPFCSGAAIGFWMLLMVADMERLGDSEPRQNGPNGMISTPRQTPVLA
jgi:hypothetical protein